MKARRRIRDAQFAAEYYIDRSTVKLGEQQECILQYYILTFVHIRIWAFYLSFLILGCCEWWTKRSKRIATLEFDRIRKSMSVIVREPTGNNCLLVKVIITFIFALWFLQYSFCLLCPSTCFDPLSTKYYRVPKLVGEYVYGF